MRRSLLIMFLGLFFVGCSERREDQLLNMDKKHLKDSIPSPAIKKPQVSNIQNHFTPEFKQTPWQGTVSAPLKWDDARGQNILIISGMEADDWPESLAKLAPSGDFGLTEFFAYHYVYSDSLKKWRAYWTLNDYEFHYSDKDVMPFPACPFISDVDSNGIAETAFAYYISYDPIDFYYRIKLIYHPDSIKMKMEGSIGLFHQGFCKINHIDPGPKFSGEFESRSKVHRDYMKRLWSENSAFQDSLDLINQREWSK